jgi:methylated-DNA-protein-cysteine methyltransferase-like protein
MMEKPDSEPGQGQKHAAPGQPTASQLERRTALYTALAQIPAGCVVSYGQLAAYAGLGRAARWVGRTLSQLPDGSILPWHRVIAAGGRLSLSVDSLSGAEQRIRLREEGVQIHNDRVDMPRYGWRPMEHSG